MVETKSSTNLEQCQRLYGNSLQELHAVLEAELYRLEAWCIRQFSVSVMKSLRLVISSRQEMYLASYSGCSQTWYQHQHGPW